MRPQRSFTVEFKRQLIEELLSGISTAAQLSRRHHISSGLLYHWKKQYAKSGFGAEPAQEVVREGTSSPVGADGRKADARE